VIASTIEKSSVEVVGTGQSGPAPFIAKLEKGKAYKVTITAARYLAKTVDVKAAISRSSRSSIRSRRRSTSRATRPARRCSSTTRHLRQDARRRDADTGAGRTQDGPHLGPDGRQEAVRPDHRDRDDGRGGRQDDGKVDAGKLAVMVIVQRPVTPPPITPAPAPASPRPTRARAPRPSRRRPAPAAQRLRRRARARLDEEELAPAGSYEPDATFIHFDGIAHAGLLPAAHEVAHGVRQARRA